jgi:hypothetical protein
MTKQKLKRIIMKQQRPHLLFALRGVLTALAALVLAELLGLECPAFLCSGSAAWWESWKRQCHTLAS